MTSFVPHPPGIYPPWAPIAVLASTPWEAEKFTLELYYQGCVRGLPHAFDLMGVLDLSHQLRGMVFSAWLVDADLMVMTQAWINAVANTLTLSGGVIITFDRDKLRNADNL